MSRIDIFDIKPHKVTRDLSGKTFLFYGGYKTGKTTNACKFPKPLLLAFEKGYNMIDGVIAQPIMNWRDACEVHRQLIADQQKVDAGLKEDTTFKTIIIDTADIAWDLCGAYIAQQGEVDQYEDIPYGKGHRKLKQTFQQFFQDLAKAGYTLVIISHSVEKSLGKDDPAGIRVEPTLTSKALDVIAGMVDLIAYAHTVVNEKDETEVWLEMRETESLLAGSRNPYTSERIPFTYEALLKDMSQAVDKIADVSENGVTDEPSNPYADQSVSNYDDLMKQIQKQAKTLRDAGYQDSYSAVITKHLGQDKKAKDCTPAQAELLGIIRDELEMTMADLGLIPA